MTRGSRWEDVPFRIQVPRAALPWEGGDRASAGAARDRRPLCVPRGSPLLCSGLTLVQRSWLFSASDLGVKALGFPTDARAFKGVSPAAPAAPFSAWVVFRDLGLEDALETHTHDTLRPPHPPAVARAARLLRLGPGVQS